MAQNLFYRKRPFPGYSNYLAGEEGNIVNEKNDIIGTHSGLVFYTLGQRQGLESRRWGHLIYLGMLLKI